MQSHHAGLTPALVPTLPEPMLLQCRKCLYSGGWESCSDTGRCLTCRVSDGYKRLPVNGKCVKVTN